MRIWKQLVFVQMIWVYSVFFSGIIVSFTSFDIWKWYNYSPEPNCRGGVGGVGGGGYLAGGVGILLQIYRLGGDNK